MNFKNAQPIAVFEDDGMVIWKKRFIPIDPVCNDWNVKSNGFIISEDEEECTNWGSSVGFNGCRMQKQRNNDNQP